MLFEPKCLATGIGSMPFTGAAEAMSLIKENLPHVPHWPQLPLRGRREHFINQFLRPLVKAGLLVEDGDKIYFDTTKPGWVDSMTEFYTIYLAREENSRSALAEFVFPEDSVLGFYAFLEDMKKEMGKAVILKGHVVGPLSVAFQVKDEQGRTSLILEKLRLCEGC